MPRKPPLTSIATLAKIAICKSKVGDVAAFVNERADEGCDAVAFGLSLDGDTPCFPGISASPVGEGNPVAEALARGLSTWVYLELGILNQGRVRHVSGRLNSWQATEGSTESELLDFSSLGCQKSDRLLLNGLRQRVADVQGFVVEPAIDLRVFSDSDRYYYSPSFRREFADRHGYDPLPRFARDDPRFRRDYVSTWEDMLFRLHSSLTQGIRELWRSDTPVVYWESHAGGSLGPNVFRMSVETGSELAIEERLETPESRVLDSLATSVRRLSGVKRSWRIDDHRVMSVLTGDDRSPVFEAALIYNWDALVAMDAQWRREYVESFDTLCQCLLQSGITFEVVPPQFLTTADEPTESGGFRRGEVEFRCVLCPFGWLFRQIDWEILESFCLQGGKVIFYGDPPQSALEGTNLRAAFDKLLNAKTGTRQESYTGSLRFEYQGTTFESASQGTVFTLQTGSPLMTSEDQPLAAREANAVYLAYDAGKMMPSLVVTILRELLTHASDN
ncbi:MAG: hypothetical protein HY318_19945 [Armatimonadetes bacterium]|nr:hypothetical protein [Armatimonadota bacterium]